MTDRDSEAGGQPRGVLPSRRERDSTAADPVDPETILDGVEDLSVYAWAEAAESDDEPAYLGPAAEEVYDAFGVGESPERVAAGDTDGVAIAAIQGLSERLEEYRDLAERQRRRIDRQRADVETLRERLEAVQSELVALRQDREEE
jgi:uncharacterized coiled-coil protein SlyX